MRARRRRSSLALGLAIALMWTTAAHALTWTAWGQWPAPVKTGQYSVASDPSVLKDGTFYRMFYTCLDVNTLRTAICEAVSTDGFYWQDVSTGNINGLVYGGNPNGWDMAVETPSIVKYGSFYYLYYTGYSVTSGSCPSSTLPYKIGLAVSSDGVTFIPYQSTPVMTATPGGLDSFNLQSPDVIVDATSFKMVYYGIGGTPAGSRILGAESSDGVHWTKRTSAVYTANPSISWMVQGVAEPAWTKGPDGRYYLFVTGLGSAYGSPSPPNPPCDPGGAYAEHRNIGELRGGTTPWGAYTLNPTAIVTEKPGTWQENVIAPTVRYENNKMRMWYLGSPWPSTSIAIGYAEAGWPLWS